MKIYAIIYFILMILRSFWMRVLSDPTYVIWISMNTDGKNTKNNTNIIMNAHVMHQFFFLDWGSILAICTVSRIRPNWNALSLTIWRHWLKCIWWVTACKDRVGIQEFSRHVWEFFSYINPWGGHPTPHRLSFFKHNLQKYIFSALMSSKEKRFWPDVCFWIVMWHVLVGKKKTKAY